MTMGPIAELGSALYGYFAAPQLTVGLAASRIVLGLVLAVDGLRMLRTHRLWYASDALRAPLDSKRRLPAAIDLFAWAEGVGVSSRWVPRVLVASALAFAAGLGTKVAGAVLLLALLSVPPRNLFIVYGGDAFARTVLLLLLLSPCGSSVSVDAWFNGASLGLRVQAAPWGGRLIQIEVALLYAYNFVRKVRMPAWRDGSAMFDVLRNRNFARADLPAGVANARVAVALAWGTLAVEAALAPTVLFSPTATVACLVAIVFHLAIARALDVHLFSYVMLAALVVCLPPRFWLSWIPGDLPPLPVDAIDVSGVLAVTLCLAYVGYALLWDAPGRGPASRAVRRLLGSFLARIHWPRSWRLFVEGTCRHQLEIEFVTVDEHAGVSRWMWLRPDTLVPAADAERRPQWPGHRFQRFKFCVADREEARERLVARFRRAVEGASVKLRALSIDVLFIDVRHASRQIVGGRGVHAQIGVGPDGRVDVDACARLAAGVRCPPTRAKLLQLMRACHQRTT